MNQRTVSLAFLAAVTVVAASIAPVDAARGFVTYPNAWNLLNKALKDQGKEVSAHGVGTSKLTTTVKIKQGVEKVVDSGWFNGDALMAANGRSRIAEQAIETAGTKQTALSYSYITIGKKLAVAPTSTKKWKCQSFSLLNKIPEWTPISFGVLSLKPKPSSAKVVGTDTINGAPVWQVQIVVKSKSTKATQTTNFLIDQKTFAIRDMSGVATGTEGGQKWQQSVSILLTKFGEPVSSKMPVKC